MSNNGLIKYEDNFISKIFKKIRLFFFRKKDYISNEDTETEKEDINIEMQRTSFLDEIKIKVDEKLEHLKNLKRLYDKKQIKESELTDDEIKGLIELYNQETAEYEADTKRRLLHIEQMQKKLKPKNA